MGEGPADKLYCHREYQQQHVSEDRGNRRAAMAADPTFERACWGGLR
jgi:hypothetical protein